MEVLDSEGAISPFPDRQLTTGPRSPDPAVAVEAKETTELLLVAALLQLPPRQRIALIAREFLELTAAQTAALLDVSVPSANSLVQRARAEIRRRRGAPTPTPDTAEDELVRRYVRAHVDGDVHAIAAMLADDVRVSMPPERPLVGREAATSFFTAVVGLARPGQWWLVPVRANGRPATANYLRTPGTEAFRATSVDVLEIRAGQLAVVNCFLSGRHFPAFGLPEILDEPPGEGSRTVLPRLDLNQ